MRKNIIVIFITITLFWSAFCTNVFSQTLITPEITPENLEVLKNLQEFIGDGLRIEGKTAYLYLEYISYERFWKQINKIKYFSIDKIVIELYSHGGSLFNAMAMGALIEEQSKTKIVEIRAKGLVASAGLIVLVSGSKGHRFIDQDAMIMFHELVTFKFFAVETTTSKEDEAEIMRAIQNKVNGYISKRSKISSQELAGMIKRREFWMTAETAIKFGFADNILNL